MLLPKSYCLASLSELQPEHESKAGLDFFEELASYAAGEFGQKITVDGDDLRHISHGVFRQACGFGREQHVARGIDETSVGAQHDGNDRLHAAPVEGLALHNQDGSVVSGFRAVGFAEISPPDLPAFDYHVSRASDRLCRRRTERGNRLSSDA